MHHKNSLWVNTFLLIFRSFELGNAFDDAQVILYEWKCTIKYWCLNFYVNSSYKSFITTLKYT